ncbi:hypothetical protein QCA50_009822 [Cerrena zonata]|uniref:Uncharacterized protein n=1 Tax=Cerrena zonata TaxID=2478898 RepID=A0AAW0GCH4_9APHY
MDDPAPFTDLHTMRRPFMRAQTTPPRARLEIHVVARKVITFLQLNRASGVYFTDLRAFAQHHPEMSYFVVAEERFGFDGFECCREHAEHCISDFLFDFM